MQLDAFAPWDGTDYSMADFRRFARYFRSDGAIRGTGPSGFEASPFRVTPATGRNIQVHGGECFIRGAWGLTNGTPKILPIAPNTSGAARIDLVVLRHDADLQRIELDVKTGTSPSVIPPLTRNTQRWEIQVAGVVVPNGFSSLVAGDIVYRPQFTDAAMRKTVNVNQQMIGSALTRVNFGTMTFPSSDVEDLGSGRFRLLRAGQWIITSSIQMTANTSGGRGVFFAREGQEDSNRLAYTWDAPPASGALPYRKSTTLSERFAADTVVGLWVWQNAGGVDIYVTNSSAQENSISFYWLGL